MAYKMHLYFQHDIFGDYQPLSLPHTYGGHLGGATGTGGGGAGWNMFITRWKVVLKKSARKEQNITLQLLYLQNLNNANL